jgi:uncharacterized protein YndB with AHSA1/START domain
MRRLQGFVLLLLVALPFSGCGDSMAELNRLAAAGAIHENAPVKMQLQVEIAASNQIVWDLLVDAPAWPSWQKGIESVTTAGPIGAGTRFTWRTGGTTIESQVQLFEPERRLSWTGKALTAKAIHVWELQPIAGDRTLLTMKESMDGPLMAKLYPSAKLAEADAKWMTALKQAAEERSLGNSH